MLIYIILGVHGVQEAPQMPLQIVRKFCCFELLNGKSRRERPMNQKFDIIWRSKQLFQKFLQGVVE